MGVVIVGPSGSGKTTLWRNLKNALAKCGQVVKTYVMNPKAMPRTQVSYNVVLHVVNACLSIFNELFVLMFH